MKTIFEATDLVGDKPPYILGRILRRGPKDEHWLVGYMAGLISEEPRYYLVSLRDGMISGPAMTADQFVDRLNTDPGRLRDRRRSGVRRTEAQVVKSYRDSTGEFHRTQADAKASGHPFEPVDIPTDHAGLIAFVNSLREPDPLPEPERPFTMVPGAGAAMMLKAAENMGLYDDPATRRPYQNGDPTTPVMKSRDPMARFTCRSCGVVNKPEPD